ncbi:tyrosine-type recombinase/integrase [Bradyrhizobium sp. 160]|uniref:site-specific integrase n=1 Tax=Bradyrhizobium sp. 160 TaxID=2782634 RepID=UPI001FF9F47A|nr:site-specific integrase [Bradyrhizobium sp. 160]MCK1627500.1 tyrosine-type recombinase/integrase [Bradyrhizobium sp. 160]
MIEPTPFRTEQLRLETGERFSLTVAANGMPAWWPNLYCQIAIRERNIGYSTMQAYMNAICVFHNVCAKLDIDIDARIESLELFRENEIATIRDELRKRQIVRPGDSNAVKAAHWKSRLTAVNDYIVWRTDPVIDRVSTRDPRLAEVRRRVDRLPKRLVGKIVVSKNSSKEGMDEKTEVAFLDAITPDHPTNPFNPRNQHRNQALWLLYHAGLRRSAPLTLTGRHLHLNEDEPYVYVPRVQDDKDDSRAHEPRNKTKAHPVNLSPDRAAIIHRYIVNHRPTYKGAKKSKYVFLSQESSNTAPKPLSIGSVEHMYKQLRAKVPGIPENFGPHMVRRTNKDHMKDAADELEWTPDEEEEVVNQESGWTRNSKTRLNYQRRSLRKKGNKLAVKMQDMATKGRKDD